VKLDKLIQRDVTSRVDAAEIAIQSNHPPLQFTDAAPGGTHPLGGQVKAFVDHANAVLGPLGTTFTLHVSGKVNPADRATTRASPAEHPAAADTSASKSTVDVKARRNHVMFVLSLNRLVTCTL